MDIELTPDFALQYDEVVVTYGSGRPRTTAVDGVSLSVPCGTTLGLVGESGSGKSTLARATVGLVPLAAGEILVHGHPLNRSAREIQMVYQDPFSSLDPRMSIGRSVAETLPPRTKHALARRRTQELLELVKIDPARIDDYPKQFSGGQLQRIAIARALAGDPEIVIADEITSALDASVQGAVLNLLKELQSELGLTMLFISHDLPVVRFICDHVAVMHRGWIVETGARDEVLNRPREDYTKELISAADFAIVE